MVEWHTKSNRKISGGKRYTKRRCTKKKAWMGGEAANTKVEETDKESRNVKSGRGESRKIRVTRTKYANVFQDGKVVKAEIIGVKENLANRLFARSNTGTKGALINIKIAGSEKTAKITNRPGQDGVINAIIAE